MPRLTQEEFIAKIEESHGWMVKAERDGSLEVYYVTSNGALGHALGPDMGGMDSPENHAFLGCVNEVTSRPEIRAKRINDLQGAMMERWLHYRNIRTNAEADALELTEDDVAKARLILGLEDLKEGDFIVRYLDASFRTYPGEMFNKTYYRSEKSCTWSAFGGE